MLVLHPPIIFWFAIFQFFSFIFFLCFSQISKYFFLFFSFSNSVFLLSSCLSISVLLYYTYLRLFFPLYLCLPFDICVFLRFFPHLKLLVCFPASILYLLLRPSHCPYICHCHGVSINICQHISLNQIPVQHKKTR